MGKDVPSILITIKKQKSISPFILGAIGFVLNLPNICCSFFYAVVMKAIEQDANFGAKFEGMTTAEAQKSTQGLAKASEAMTFLLFLLFVFWITCFIFSFFGMSTSSRRSGIITIVCSLGLLICCCLSFSFLGLLGTLFYLLAGVMSCLNFSRGK